MHMLRPRCIETVAFAALAFGAAQAGAVTTTATGNAYINCGNHFARSCDACQHTTRGVTTAEPGTMCGGECVWLKGSCQAAAIKDGFKDAASASGWSQVFQYVVPACLAAVFAALYKKQVVEKLPHDKIDDRSSIVDELRLLSTREVDLFSCCKDRSTCAYAVCCGPAVAAKNYEVGRVLSFWPSCIMLYLAMPFSCVFAVLRAVLSSKLKRNMGLEGSCLQDFCLNLFCFPCEVGRESMEVDDMLEVEIRCFNKVRSIAPELPPNPAAGFLSRGCCSSRKCGGGGS
mmetsp:Transcript_20566/g.58260  ORF Transcript_20566/g.58260 Transcript_20566/m.58260 type:complete len:287 (-) Transcript_20566:99-959(-)